jgi:hypothetical protein
MRIRKNDVILASKTFNEVPAMHIFEFQKCIFLKLDSNFNDKYFSSFQENAMPEDKDINEEDYISALRYNAIRLSVLNDDLDRRTRLVFFDVHEVVYNVNKFILVGQDILEELERKAKVFDEINADANDVPETLNQIDKLSPPEESDIITDDKFA